jgi:hypothetical protein
MIGQKSFALISHLPELAVGHYVHPVCQKEASPISQEGLKALS